MAPIDLMVDVGPDGWNATYNEGAGIEVTPENWADAYELEEEQAASEIAESEKLGLEGAATEQWRLEPSGPDAGYSSLRLTIRRFTSLAAADVQPSEYFAANVTPPGVSIPDGMQLACRDAEPADTARAGDYYAGAFYADCIVTIGDTIHVYLSSIAPEATSTTDAAHTAITQWLDGNLP